MAPAPESASKDFLKVVDQLWREFFPLSCTVSKGSETEEATGCLRDSFGDDVTVFDDGTPELKPNTVVDVYGYLSAPTHTGEERYSRPGGTPLCFLPLNIVGVTDSKVAHKIVEMVRHLMPKVKVVTLTPELLSKTRFAPVKNYESDVLHQGELQLSNGTVLIIDETQLPSGSFPVSGFVEENLKVLEELIVEHRMLYDYGFYKIPMDVDYNVLILSKKESRFFKTPFRIPIEPSSSPFSLENVGDKREFLQRSRSGVSSVSLTDDVSKKVQDSFVNMCASLDAKADKAALLNEMLIISRLVASSNGSPSVEFEHWQHAIRISSANSSAMSKWRSQ
ncbi:hypothetical protein TELCIR_08227 [Teladorsagia circumcincta]|uniref:Mini-chromosome maintenance complex-binding protein n=1 Tax=Teladorsagia circumcincta TaxID=45464 RepID=A0A2G9UI65_TELCI|nr:hypothetical protein TELCIR_08227 [Teladorsagia circumcincta]